MDESIHEEQLSQPLQTINKQFILAVTFLTDYNGIFNVTNSNNKFYFKKKNDEDSFTQISLSLGAYELESLNDEIKRIIIDEGLYTEENYPLKIKPNFSTLGSIIEISAQGPIISFMHNHSIRDLLGFDSKIIYGEYNISNTPVDIISIDNIFLECDIAQVMIFKGRRSGNIQNFTKDVDPGYKYIEKFRCGVQWYMMESKDVISSICFKVKNKNNQILSFNGQSIIFRLSNKKI